MAGSDYALCPRCGRMRYLGAFCECATAAEMGKYWKAVLPPDPPRPVFEYRPATEEDVALFDAVQEYQVQIGEAPFPMTDA